LGQRIKDQHAVLLDLVEEPAGDHYLVADLQSQANDLLPDRSSKQDFVITGDRGHDVQLQISTCPESPEVFAAAI
jgi:hypothetical protein